MATENGFFTNQTQFQNDPNVSQRDNLKGFYGVAVRPAYIKDLVAKAEEAAVKSYEYSQDSKQYRDEAEVIRNQTGQVYNDTVVQATNAANSASAAATSESNAAHYAELANQRFAGSVESFIQTGSFPGGAGTRIEFAEFYIGTGVGGGVWAKTGVTGLTPSQTPEAYYNIDNSKKKHFVDSVGDEWIFIGSLDDYSSLGGFKADEFWSNSGGIIKRFKDRLFVDDAVVNSGDSPATNKTWLGKEANGFMTYFDTRSSQETISSIGATAHAAGVRTSDNDRVGEKASIAYAAYTLNDKNDPSDKKTNWCYYGLSVRAAQHAFATFALEMNVANTVNDEVRVNPFNAAPEGLTVCYRARNGGEISESGITVYGSSAAYDITHHNASGSYFLCGINVQDGSLKKDVNGNSIFAQLPKGAAINWYYGGGVGSIGGSIKSTGNSALNAVFMDFGPDGLDFGKAGDERQLRYNPNSKTLFPVATDSVSLGLASRQFSEVNSALYKTNGLTGASGSFTSSDGKTITVTNGIITSIV